MSVVIKMTEVNNTLIHNKIVKKETLLDTFAYIDQL